MATTRRTVRLLDPTAKPQEDVKSLAPRLAGLRGQRIGILDNTKSNADVLMLRLAELLCEQYEASEIVHRRKAHAAVGATVDMLDDIARRCDAVLVGSGD